MFQERLDQFVALTNEKLASHNQEKDYNWKTEVRVRNPNSKYVALDNYESYNDGEMKNRGVFCFIVRQDGVTKGLGQVLAGDVMKPASYKTPAKHSRGNIFSEDNGMEFVGAYGPAYLRG
jgi:hypothetical protein